MRRGLLIATPPFIFSYETFRSIVSFGISKLPFPLQNVRVFCHFAVIVTFFFPLTGFAPQSFLAAQSPSRSDSAKSKDAPANPAELALRKRLEVAQAAQRSNDPAAVAQANRSVIALALRELGQLRLLQTALPQAMELYKRSLDFEDIPDTHVDLAVTELQAGLYDQALAESSKALTIEPDNSRAFIVRSRVLIRKQDYGQAADALNRLLQLDKSYESDVETLYSLGICLLQTKIPGDKQKAAAVFERMVAAQGDSGSLHVLFGRAYRDAGDMTSAIQEFERAIAIDTRTPHAHYFLGLALLAVNEWRPTPEVRAEFAKELQLNPKDYLANYLVGFLASGDRDYAVSNRHLEIAAQLSPTAPEPWLYLGLNAYAQGDMARAEQYLRKAVVLTGDDVGRSNYQIRRAYVDLGRILVNSGRTEESEVFLGKARDLQNKTMELTQQDVASTMAQAGGAATAAVVPLQASPGMEAATLPAANVNNDPFARVDASVTAHSSLTSEQLAIAAAQETRLRAALALGFNDLATSEAVRGEYLAALGHYQEAEHWDAHIPGLARNLGSSAFRVQNYPEAIRGLKTALEEKSADKPVRAMLGMAYFAAERFSDATKTFSPLGVDGMRDSTVGYAWASSLSRINEPGKAAAILSEFEKANRSGNILLLVGQLWIEIGDYARSVSTLHGALQAEPSLPKAHYFAGQADTRWTHWPEAAAEFQAELAIVPGDPDAMYGLGFVYLQQNKVDEAAALFQQIIAAYPNHANSQYQIGKILLDRGRVPDAIEHLQIATRLNPRADYMHYQLQIAYRKESRMEDADRELAVYKELKEQQRAHDRQSIPNIQSP
jgi:tetratricopeptide (TPR) repeat protein